LKFEFEIQSLNQNKLKMKVNEKYDNSTVKSIKYDEQTLPFIQNITTNKPNKGKVNSIIKSDLNLMS